MESTLSSLAWRSVVLSAALALALQVPAPAQILASVDLLGMGCGTPPPALNSTLPVYTMPMTIFVSNAPPQSPLVLLITMPPTPPLTQLAPGCFLWVDPVGSPGHPPLVVVGSTNPEGVFSFTIPLSVMQSLQAVFPPGVICNAQALIVNGGPGSVQFPWFDGFATNGLALRMGDPPGNMTPGTPDDPRTFTKTEFGGSGPAGQLLMGTFSFAFPLGLEVGDYSPMMGAAPPNGKLWTLSGLTALKSYLMTGGGISGSFDMDALNTSQDCGGGPLGRHTAALAMNVAFSDLGLLGFSPGLFRSLIYVDPGSSLHMQTVDDIFAAAQNALAGFALPSGFNYVTLAQLVEQLNLSFHNSMLSMWAMMHLLPPMP